DTGSFYCGAMLGFDAGENLFQEEAARGEAYRPLNLQRGPFYTAGNDLAIDLEHARVAAGGGEALFEESGKPTAYLQSIMALMRELRPGLERTKVFVAKLLELRLVVPLSIDLSFDDGTRRELDGLYGIDQEALRALPDASVVELLRRGYLQL